MRLLDHFCHSRDDRYHARHHGEEDGAKRKPTRTFASIDARTYADAHARASTNKQTHARIHTNDTTRTQTHSHLYMYLRPLGLLLLTMIKMFVYI